jgi:hypothetical protein
MRGDRGSAFSSALFSQYTYRFLQWSYPLRFLSHIYLAQHKYIIFSNSNILSHLASHMDTHTHTHTLSSTTFIRNAETRVILHAKKILISNKTVSCYGPCQVFESQTGRFENVSILIKREKMEWRWFSKCRFVHHLIKQPPDMVANPVLSFTAFSHNESFSV